MRKRVKIFVSVLFFLSILWYLMPLLYLYAVIKPAETYPIDTFLQTVKNKRALIIVAHHDDSYGNVAVAKLLTNMNWDVRAFYFSPTLNQIEHIEREKNGVQSANKVADLLNLEEFSRLDQVLRFDSIVDHRVNYPYADFKYIFQIDSVETTILNLINKYQPSVIFTLDNVIGLYGHSDHVFISQSILNVCNRNKSIDNFPVERIYQSVMPPSQTRGVMVKYQKFRQFLKPSKIISLIKNKGFEESVYVDAKRIYGCTGMPLPDTQIQIDTLSKYKKEFLMCWSPSETKDLKRFIPFYHWYPHWIYYKIFDYEYFKTIAIK